MPLRVETSIPLLLAAEPFNPEHIKQHSVAFTQASGYKYGSNYLNLDVRSPTAITVHDGNRGKFGRANTRQVQGVLAHAQVP